MIPAETIARDYRFVYNEQGYNPSQITYDAVLAHAHYSDDTTSLLPRLVHAAVTTGIDRITVSDHNSTRSHDKVSDVILNHGYEIVMIPSIEVSARGPQKEQVRHVLAYGVENTPPAGLSPAEVNAWAHEQQPAKYMKKVVTTAAHPELMDFSVREEELAGMEGLSPDQKFDLVEIVNGQMLSINAWRAKHPFMAGILGDRMPDRETNNRMEKIVLGQQRLPVIGGDDSHHYREVANVVNLVPQGMDIFDAAQSGQLVVIAKSNPAATATWRFGIGHIRGRMMETRSAMQRKKAASSAF